MVDIHIRSHFYPLPMEVHCLKILGIWFFLDKQAVDLHSILKIFIRRALRASHECNNDLFRYSDLV